MQKSVFFIGIFVLTAIAVSLITYFLTDKMVKAKSHDICETDDCVIRAAELLQDMDKSVEPCDDFYEFACGNFKKRTKIPETQSSMSKLHDIANRLNDQLHDLFESGINSSDIQPFRMVKKFYDACMDVDRVEETSEDEMKALLRELGGWPVLEGDEWDEGSFDLGKTALLHRENGLWPDFFFRSKISMDLKNNSQISIDLDQPKFKIPRENFQGGLKNPFMKGMHDLMVDLAVMLGANRSRAESELLDALNFNAALINITVPKEQLRDYEKQYNQIKISELKDRFKTFDLANYINKTLEGYSEVEDDDIINIKVPKFFDDVFELISRTSKRVQSNYVHWTIVLEKISAMGKKYHDRLMAFAGKFFSVTTEPPRQVTCVSGTMEVLPLAVGSLYIRRFFDKSAKNKAVEMTDDIKTSFRNIMNTVNWMDEKTRAKALEKLEHLKPFVAFPDEFMEDSKLEEYYANLEQLNNSLFLNELKISKYRIHTILSQLSEESSNSTEWIAYGNLVATVNAFYASQINSMILPAAILQGVMFGKERPAYMNYGTIGWFIGHEITHGFDDQGRQFDNDGNLADWWAEESKKRYLERAQCIIDQYGNYTVEEVGLNVNGITTQGENIADNGGVKEAYYAYKRYEKIHGPEPSLPGFSKYTSKQLFWLSAANVWCKVFRPKALKNQILTDPHTPDKYRVIGTFSNMQEFSKDYNCPSGSPMNPKKKCTVW